MTYKLFLLDPAWTYDNIDDRRRWEKMLPEEFIEVEWSQDKKCFITSVTKEQVIGKGIVIIHCSRLDTEYRQDAFFYAKECGLLLVLISAGSEGVKSDQGHVYYRINPVLEYGYDNIFKNAFFLFWEDLNRNGVPNFKLLEPDDKKDESLNILSVLCQGYLLTHHNTIKEDAGTDFTIYNESLTRMRLDNITDFRPLDSILRPELFDPDKRSLLQDAAASNEYWHVFDRRYEEIIESIRSEQDEANTYSKISELLNLVTHNNKTNTIQLKTVADTFNAITEKQPLNIPTIESEYNSEDNTQRKVFICSEDSAWAEAINNCLSLLTDLLCFIVPSTKPDVIASDLHLNSLNYSGISDAICIVHYNGNSSDVISQCINATVFLRNSRFQYQNYQSRWIGGFIGVLKNNSYAKEINNSSLLGNEIDSGIRFDSLGINKCITNTPLSILQLLFSISTIGILGRHEWDKIYSSYPAKRLYDYAVEKRNMIESNIFYQADIPRVYEYIKNEWSQINWRATLAHEWKNHIKYLDRIPLPKANSEMKQFLCKAIQILEQLFSFQGIQEENINAKPFEEN